MRKIYFGIVSVILAVTLCACGATVQNEAQPFSLGTVETQTYESRFLGIGCLLPEGWRYYTTEEIQQLNNYAAEEAGEDFQAMMEQADLVYDMFAKNENGMDTVNVVMEKLSPVQYAALDLTQHLRDSAPVLQQTFENIGATGYTYEIGTIVISGQELTCLYSSCILNGNQMYQASIPIKANGYLASLTITTWFENSAQTVGEYFYFL